MAWIAGAEGIFRLHESDTWCGSLVSVEDAAEILDVQVSDLSNVPQRVIDHVPYVVELVEDALGEECVIWPFWIQRCARNVLALFNGDIHAEY